MNSNIFIQDERVIKKKVQRQMSSNEITEIFK